MAEVIALETELGTNSAGAISTTVAARIAVLETARCQQTRTAISIGNNTLTDITFNSALHTDFDPRDWHDPSSNPGRITPNLTGWYRVTALASWATDTDYIRVITEVLKNGLATTPTREIDVAAATSSQPGVSAAFPLIKLNGTTDYISMRVFQSNTGAGSNNVDATLLVELVYPTTS
jgi:hypothetical protein